MKRHLLYPILVLLVIQSCKNSPNQNVQLEPQVSFVLDSKPHEYYVEQAELWWAELERDKTNEEAWFSYYRACRNAQGTADWKEDFVDESPNLRLGNDIVSLMEEHIPDTFTLFYVKGSTGAVDPTEGQYLVKAYEMNPEFLGIHAAMVTYSVSTGNDSLRKAVNEKWNAMDDINPGLLKYARNALASCKPNGVLFTQGDNDTYPLWLLQDAFNQRTDVSVINIDFLLLDMFRHRVFEELNLPPFELTEVHVDEYRTNWTNVMHHVLNNYHLDRPIYLSKTVSSYWYEGFEDSLKVEGLTFRYQPKADNTERNVDLVKTKFNLNDLTKDFTGYYSQGFVNEMNVNYLDAFFIANRAAKKSNDADLAAITKMLAVDIVTKLDNSSQSDSVKAAFDQ